MTASPQGRARLTLTRLRGLLDDLTRIAQGDLPCPAELRDAPFLDLWATAVRPQHCLVGRVVGHPSLNGPRVTTSALHVVAPALGWARTTSRFYALGRPHPASVIAAPCHNLH